MTHSAAREILRQAWLSTWNREPTSSELTYIATIAYLETVFTTPGEPSSPAGRASQGVFNWGVLDRKPDAAGVCASRRRTKPLRPPHTAKGSAQGTVCFYAFPSDVGAAAAFRRKGTHDVS